MTTFCTHCDRYHGCLYICPSYDDETKERILGISKTFKENLQNKDWIQKQIDNGVTEEALSIMRIFAG